jgi:hypothetical protein
MLNGIGDPLWRILRVAPYNNGILSNTELQALIPNTVEGFGVDNANGIPLFQVRGLGDLSYFNSPLKIGQYTLPNTDGTNNQVLTTDGSGTVSWKNIVGGTGDRYFATSSTYLTIPSVGTTLELITQPNLSYTVGQIVLISTTFSESFYGDVDYTSDFDLIPSFQGEIEYYDSVSGTMSVITTYSKRTGLTFSDWIISLGNVPNIPTNIGSFSFYDTTITTTWSGSDIVIESLNSDIILKGNSIYWGSIVGQMPNGGSYSYGSSVTSDDNFIYTIGGDDNIGYGLIVKTDINGNIIWKKEIVENSYGECIVVKNNTIFTLFTDNKNSGNILIVQLDTDSNILNQWSFTGPTTVYGFDMDTDESNNVYFVGYQSDTITLNSDLVIGKLNTSIDNIDWIYQAGVNKDDFNGSGIKYSNGFIYVTGYDNNGGILMKYDINGSLVWSNYTSSALEPRSITVDSSGNIYLCGSAGIVSTSFIMMLKPNGSLNWVHNINIGFNNLMATSIDIDNNGNLYILGINSTRFFGTSNFYYAKLLAYDGSIVFQKFLTISGYSESTIYDNGHRNIKYNNNTLYINGYLDTRGGDNMILISLPSDDLLTGSYVNPISGDTWIISDASYSLALNTSSIINGPSISSATLSSATSSFVLIDSLIDGYELTQFTYFQTIIEGNLNIGYNYVLPNIAGTVGQALIFPSSGNILEWQTITASGGGSQNLDEVLSIGNTSSTNIILSSGGFTNTLAVNYIQLISGVNSLSFNAGPTSTPFIGYNVNGNNLSIYSNPTSNNNIIVPDKSGIIALLSDITGGGGSQSLDQVLSVGNTSSQSINITDGHYTASISFNNILLEDNFGDSTYITSGDIVVYGGVYNLGLNGIGFFFQGTSSINYLTGPAYSGNYTWQLPSNSGMIALLSDLPAVGATGPRGATGANGLLATTNMYTIPYAPTFTYDNANGTLQQITLTGSATMNFSGISAGVFYFLEVTQDSIGSRTITWPTVTVAYGGGGIVPISTTPNSTDRYIIFYNGTKYRIDYALNYT